MRLHIGFFLTIHFILILGDFYHSWKITFASCRGIFHISRADIFKWMLPSTQVSVLVYQFSYELGIFYGISACQFYSHRFFWTLKTLWVFFMFFYVKGQYFLYRKEFLRNDSVIVMITICNHVVLYINFTSLAL